MTLRLSENISQDIPHLGQVFTSPIVADIDTIGFDHRSGHATVAALLRRCGESPWPSLLTTLTSVWHCLAGELNLAC